MGVPFMADIDLVVCDLDGTLCDIRHRQHLAQAGDWDAFHEGLQADKARKIVLSFILAVVDDPTTSLVFLTGRPEDYRMESEAWLKAHGIEKYDDYIDLLMRPRQGAGSDTVVKQALLEEFLISFRDDTGLSEEEQKSRILILDDRDKVVAHFRDLGYECWQVNEGAF